MKKIYLYVPLLLILLSSCSSSRTYTQSGYSQGYDQGYNNDESQITYQQFYDGLSPYGNWVNYGNYGYAWTPNDQGFRPYYSNGHWVYTTDGWTWASDYNWGWAPFHYGRWMYDNDYGWMWLPGYQWAPAWVSWRSGGDYYGWAPMGPGTNAGGGYYGSDIPDNNWAFVPNRYINSPRINNYYINTQQNTTIINNTTVINNTYINNNKTVYVTGPSVTDVERHTNQKIGPVKIVQTNTPGRPEVNGSTLKMYRPFIKQAPQQKQNTQVYRPARVTNLSDQRTFHQQHAEERNVPANTNTQEQTNTNKNNFPRVHNNSTETQTQQQQPLPQQQAQQQVKISSPKSSPLNNNQDNHAAQNQVNENPNQSKQTPVQQQNNPAPPQRPQSNFPAVKRDNQTVNKPAAPPQNNNQQQPVRMTPQRPVNNINQQQPVNQQQNNRPLNNRMSQPQQRVNHPNNNMQNNPMRQPVINNGSAPAPRQVPSDNRKKE